MKKKLSERRIINAIRKVYRQRLAEVAIAAGLEEADMYDKRGNMILSKGLKVRHKTSGYEYTVDHVEGEGDGAVVYLRHPDQPRFEAGQSTKTISEAGLSIDLSGVDLQNVAGAKKMPQVNLKKKPAAVTDDLRLPKSSLLAVNKAEFEKEYEVE
tara:strand:- start:318 stop:782 length:465 start_codon:yes stop_codon:yes gene_type:complete